jgi:hypothetical protein
MGTTPTASLATLRPDLSGAMEQFDLDASRNGFIGLRFAPVMDVAKAAGTFGKIELAQMLADRTTERASGSGYNRVSGKGTTDSYATEEHGLEEAVDDRDVAMYREYWDAEMLAAKRARDGVLRNFERRIADIGHAITNTTAAGTAWTNTSSATPIDNVRTAVLAVYERTGIRPNAVVIPFNRLEYLKDNAQIIDRLKYAGFQNPNRDNITAQAIAQALNVEEILVADGMRNSAKEGQAASLSSIWTVSEVLVCRIARTNDHKEPCIARTFHWAEDGSQIGGTVESYRDETRRSDIMRVRMETDEKAMYDAVAQRITGA